MVEKKKTDKAPTKAETKVETTVEPEAETKAVETHKATDNGGFFVYLGPSIRGVIQTASIYEGTREEVEGFLAGAIEQYPLIKSLLVSGETLPEDRIKVKTPGNLLQAKYQQLASELRNKEV